MKITIIGAGAIGGVVGAYLAKAGEDIQFVDINSEHVNTMNEKGLTISVKENTFTVPVKAFTMEELVKSDQELEVVFLCVKALHTKEAVKQFKHLLREDSFVVSFQNGLCEYEIAEEIGADRTVGCFINLFADYQEPGLIEYGGVGSLYIGEVNGPVTSRVEKLISLLAAWGEAKATDNILGYLWSKLSYGAVLTATATTNETIADVLDNPQYHELIVNLTREVISVAERKGIVPKSFDDWEPKVVAHSDYDGVREQLHILTKRLRGYTKTRTGIWRDLAVRKRKTEVPQQLLPVIADGRKLNLELPLTTALVQMILDIELGKRQMQIDNLDELARLSDASSVS
ncbi:2-dehydropantoate 2-reductase [Bacillus sp. es.034]|uniref:ketopantoate reductase family protein n=1 Tax=Bacillus sp. es.034 TaxID=1761763 RepID=UPI000BF56F8F|nr:2-dehydropantoate 2-reductase [Bacillus sp. es.034]PFG04517.1 2-dehydropantoate 2-reductase [Bacillus sp. es.034]